MCRPGKLNHMQFSVLGLAFILQAHAQFVLTNEGSNARVIFRTTQCDGGYAPSPMGASCVSSLGLSWSNDPSSSNPVFDTRVWRVTGISQPSGNGAANSWTWGASSNIPSTAQGRDTTPCTTVSFPNGFNMFNLVTSSSATVDMVWTIGILPQNAYEGSTAKPRFLPGTLELRMKNGMGQSINGLIVRFNMQSYNLYHNRTMVKLQYTHHGAEDWYWNDIPFANFTTPAAPNATCTSNADQILADWYYGAHFIEAALTNLHWGKGEYFFLRWYITSDAVTNNYGDPIRLTDFEVIPHVVSDYDRSLRFNYSSVPSVDITAAFSQPYTFEAWLWVEKQDSRPKYYGTSFTTQEPHSDPYLTVLMSAAGNGLAVSTTDWTLLLLSSTSAVELFDAVISPDDWTHVAVTDDGTTVRVYINGLLKHSNSTLTGRSFTSPLRIGSLQTAVGGSFHSFHGFIDEVRIWSVARTAAQIQRGLELPVAANSTGLSWYLPMDTVNFTSGLTVTPNAAPSQGLATVNTKLNPLSTMSAMSLSPLTGGELICDDHYTVPNGGVLCNVTVRTRHGSLTPVPAQFGPNYIRIVQLEGPGVVGGLTMDPSGVFYTFKYFASSQLGTARLQPYAGSRPFESGHWTVHTIDEGCKACEWRENWNGIDVFSCKVGNRRFVRKGPLPTGQGCPV